MPLYFHNTPERIQADYDIVGGSFISLPLPMSHTCPVIDNIAISGRVKRAKVDKPLILGGRKTINLGQRTTAA